LKPFKPIPTNCNIIIMSSVEVTDAIMAEVPAATSISEAAHQYQLAMSQQEATPPNPTTDPVGSAMELSGDSVVNGNASEVTEVYGLIIFCVLIGLQPT
jgi:hypothetical protein